MEIYDYASLAGFCVGMLITGYGVATMYKPGIAWRFGLLIGVVLMRLAE